MPTSAVLTCRSLLHLPNAFDTPNGPCPSPLSPEARRVSLLATAGGVLVSLLAEKTACPYTKSMYFEKCHLINDTDSVVQAHTACMNFKDPQIVPCIGEQLQFSSVYYDFSQERWCKILSNLNFIDFLKFPFKKNKKDFSYENRVSVAMDCMCSKQLFVVIALQFNQP